VSAIMAEEQNPQYRQPLVFDGRKPDDGFTPNQQNIDPNRYSDPTHQRYTQRPTGYILPRSAPRSGVETPRSGVVLFGSNQQNIELKRYSDPTDQLNSQRSTGYMLPRSVPRSIVGTPSSRVAYHGYREEPAKYENRVRNNRHLVDSRNVTRYVQQQFLSDEEPEANSKTRSWAASQLSKITGYLNMQRKLLFWMFAILILIIVALLGVIVELK
jgi:hypothetical protein